MSKEEAVQADPVAIVALRERVRALEVVCNTLASHPAEPALQGLLENMPETVALIDCEGLVLHINHLPPPVKPVDMMGRPATEFMPLERRPAFVEALQRAVQTAQVQRIDISAVTGRVWESRLVPLLKDGRVYAAMIIAADVTARRHMDEQQRQSQKLEAIGQLTAGIAHNFNNMLMAILTNLALCREQLDPQLVPRLMEAEYAAERAANMVRDLMVFSRTPGRPRKREVVDLHDLVAGVVSMCRTAFDPRIKMVLTKGEVSARVSAHAGQVEQVLLNILLNARDALDACLDDAPSIDLRFDLTILPGNEPADPGRPAIRVRIRDNGPGMSEEVRVRVFDPFFTTKSIGQGTGLGLATAYGTMMDHGGAIHCESQPGAGATFTLLFPQLEEAR